MFACQTPYQTPEPVQASFDFMREVSPVETGIVAVDPALLQDGSDIRRSYSGDVIGGEGRVRKAFKYQGDLYVATSGLYFGARCVELEAYRLLPVVRFSGQPVTYSEKARGDDEGEAARNDPNGFYHGVIVKHQKQPHVLTGPPLTFKPKQ